LDHNKSPPYLILKIELFTFFQFSPVIHSLNLSCQKFYAFPCHTKKKQKTSKNIINFQIIAFLKICVQQTTSKLTCWPGWSAGHKFWEVRFSGNLWKLLGVVNSPREQKQFNFYSPPSPWEHSVNKAWTPPPPRCSSGHLSLKTANYTKILLLTIRGLIIF